MSFAQCSEISSQTSTTETKKRQKPPTAQVLNYMAKLREVPEQSDGSSADEGAPEREAGWIVHGPPMEFGVRWPIPGVSGEMVTRAAQVPTARTVESSGQTQKLCKRVRNRGVIDEPGSWENGRMPFSVGRSEELKS